MSIDIYWHDATIDGGKFDVESNELRLIIEFNINQDPCDDSQEDEFVSGVCLFRNVNPNPSIDDFLSRLSPDDSVIADVLSCEVREETPLVKTTLAIALHDLKTKQPSDFCLLEIYSEPYTFELLEI